MSRNQIRREDNLPENLLGSSFPCECGKVHTVSVRKMVVEEDAYLRLPEVLNGLSLPQSACVVADDHTYEILGGRVVRVLSQARHSVKGIVLESPPGDVVRADQPTADELLRSLPTVPLLIAVGSGTINDLTKLAAYKRNIPYVVLPTAPSMNGYTSSIVALTVSGLKTTSETTPPVAVVADLNVLVEAPAELIAAGLGDIISKPVSTADWKLSQIVNGDYFCYRPIQLIEKFEPLYLAKTEEIKLRQPEAIRVLTEALLYSGISMTIAGSSAPGSGGEHLISHTLDMQADLAGRPHGYHGTQVGLATIFTAALYEKVFQEDVPSFDVDARIVEGESPGRETSNLERYWGRLASAVEKELSFKSPGPEGKRDRLSMIQRGWDGIKRECRGFLRPWRQIKSVLETGGAATRVRDIGLSLNQFRDAVLHAREMRRRYTILDLADEFGLLEKHVDEVIRETGLWP